MPVDLFAGTRYQSNVTAAIPHDCDAARDPAPKILVFDSGLGGLTVLAEIVAARPDADYVYAADDAAFPYGRLGEAAVLERVGAVMKSSLPRFGPISSSSPATPPRRSFCRICAQDFPGFPSSARSRR